MILPFGKVAWTVSLPHVAIQMEVLVAPVPWPERTLFAVWELAVLEAGDLPLGEGCVGRVRTPDRNPNRRVGRAGAISVEDVVGGLGGRGGEGRVARREAGEAFRVGELVAVDQRRGNLLRHALEEGTNFAESKLSGVAVEVGDVLVDHRVGFEISAGVGDLRGGGFRVRHALVEQAPSGLRETGPDGGLVTGWEVALDDQHVLEDFVCLGEDLDDSGDLVPVIEPPRPVGVG